MIPNPDIGANPSPEEIQLGRNAWNLQEHLKEVLPLESYLYVCIDYVNSDGGDLIIGVVDEETVRPAVDSYTGAPCRQVIYQPAECSLAQVMDLSRAIADLDFPDRTTAHTLPDQGGRGGGIDVIICADEDADADWIESEVLRLADGTRSSRTSISILAGVKVCRRCRRVSIRIPKQHQYMEELVSSP